MLDGIATPEILVESDELQWDGPLTLANVSNGPWVGGMFHIAPMAKNDDGVLELLIAAPVTRTRILKLLPKLMRGTHMKEREIVHASVRRVKISGLRRRAVAPRRRGAAAADRFRDRDPAGRTAAPVGAGPGLRTSSYDRRDREPR